MEESARSPSSATPVYCSSYPIPGAARPGGSCRTGPSVGRKSVSSPGSSIAAASVELLDLLREVDSRVSGVEIYSPTGTEAELFVRLDRPTLVLPMVAMGDGLQRGFEIGVAAAQHHWPFLFIDELDNGLHHSALEPVWRWLATISKKRDVQVFATTHSEECIHAAARAFTALGDDGLRVIRLDRREDRTTAAIYDRALLETAADTGIEIRG